MKFGVRFYGADPGALLEKTLLAEELGFDSVWRGDHLLLPREHSSQFPYLPPGQKLALPSDAPILDILVLFAFLSTVTERVRFATAVYILPLRDAVSVARAVQTLDIVSGGRVIFGVGAGWLREEFELVGVDFSARGNIMDESIDVLHTLWRDRRPSFKGDFYDIEECHFEPKPVQRPHPPIVVGGTSKAALRRAAARGDGWYGVRCSPEVAASHVSALRSLRTQSGRGSVPFECSIPVGRDLELATVQEYEDAGIDRLVLELGRFDDVEGREDMTAMHRFATDVMADAGTLGRAGQ